MKQILKNIASENNYPFDELRSDIDKAIADLKSYPKGDIELYFWGIVNRVARRSFKSGLVKIPGNPSIDDQNPAPVRVPRIVIAENKYAPDPDEPLYLLDALPTIQETAIKPSRFIARYFPFEQKFINAQIEQVLKDLPEDIPAPELYRILVDLATARLNNIYSDPYCLIIAVIMRTIWNDKSGKWESLYLSVSDYIRDHPQYNENDIRRSYASLIKEIARWVRQEFKKRNPVGITRSAKSEPVKKDINYEQI